MTDRFANRERAGHDLAAGLAHLRGVDDLLVLALPRGGVPVAAVVARELDAPLDVLVVRKLGVPSHPEVAMGAVASLAGSRVTVRNEDVLAHLGTSAEQAFTSVAAREGVELARREALYRAGKPPLELAGRPVLVVDDGVATGATMRSALVALRQAGAGRVTVAVPIGAADTLTELSRLADEIVCPVVPDPFWAVGQGYVDFSQTTDAEVTELLGV